MLKIATLTLAASLTLSGLAAPASAFTLPVAAPAGVAVEHVDFVCGPGMHVGYEGRHCWPNRDGGAVGGRWCPPGEHPGYDDRYCWRNR